MKNEKKKLNDLKVIHIITLLDEKMANKILGGYVEWEEPPMYSAKNKK